MTNLLSLSRCSIFYWPVVLIKLFYYLLTYCGLLSCLFMWQPFYLYQDPHITNATQRSWSLNSYIVSASINNSHVSNLSNLTNYRVVVTLSHQTPTQVGNECIQFISKKKGFVFNFKTIISLFTARRQGTVCVLGFPEKWWVIIFDMFTVGFRWFKVLELHSTF